MKGDMVRFDVGGLVVGKCRAESWLPRCVVLVRKLMFSVSGPCFSRQGRSCGHHSPNDEATYTVYNATTHASYRTTSMTGKSNSFRAGAWGVYRNDSQMVLYHHWKP